MVFVHPLVSETEKATSETVAYCSVFYLYILFSILLNFVAAELIALIE